MHAPVAPPLLAARQRERRLARLFVVTVVVGLLAAMVAPALTLPPAAPATRIASSVLGAQPAPRADGAPDADRHVRWRRPVAGRAVARGDTLAATDIVWRDTLLTHAPPRLAPTDTVAPAAGWIARRAIAAGEWLRMPAVVPPPAVTAGRPVVAVHDADGIRLVVHGLALRTAALGQRVVVRVARTRRLDAVAIAPDTVRLR